MFSVNKLVLPKPENKPVATISVPIKDVKTVKPVVKVKELVSS